MKSSIISYWVDSVITTCKDWNVGEETDDGLLMKLLIESSSVSSLNSKAFPMVRIGKVSSSSKPTHKGFFNTGLGWAGG